MGDLQNLVSGGASRFEMLFNQGLGQRALSLASSMGAVLTHLSQDQTANATSTMAYDKEVSKKVI